MKPLTLYNQLIGFCNRIDTYYSGQIKNENDSVEIRLNGKEPEEKTQFVRLQYRKEFNDWYPKINDI